MPNNWTEQDDQVLKSGYEGGYTAKEIAEALGRTSGAVRGRASALGLSRKAPEKVESGPPPETVCQFCGQYLMEGTICDCPLAEQERRRKDQIYRAKKSIRDIFWGRL